MISIVVVSQNKKWVYLLHLGSVNKNKLSQIEDFKLILIPCLDEKNLLQEFFRIMSKERVDIILYYNGDTFDYPYFLERCQHYDLKFPSISWDGDVTRKCSRWIHTGYTIRNITFLESDSILTMDLVLYYRNFYQHFNSYRLDSVGKKLTGMGKTGLSISRMLEYVRSDDPDKMAVVADYSIFDSVLMWYLYLKINNLDVVCNSFNLEVNDILRGKPGDVLTLLGKEKQKKEIRFPLGCCYYRNVKIVDYSSKLLDLPENKFIYPWKLYCDVEKIKDKTEFISLYRGILTIKEEKKKEEKEERVLRKVNHLLVFDRESCLEIYSDGTFALFGFNTIIKTNSIIRKELMSVVVESIYKYGQFKYKKEDIKKLIYTCPREYLIQTDRFQNSCFTTGGIVEHQLSQKYERNGPIITFITKPWIYTKNGPSFYTGVEECDRGWYYQDILKFLEYLVKPLIGGR